MTKPAFTIAEQIALIEARGLRMDAAEKLRLTRLLISNNYYRLSGYWRYFQVAPHTGDNSFKPGISLDEIESVHEFDATLRSIVGDGLATVEIAFRSRLAYALATLDTPCGYLDRNEYSTEASIRRDGATAELRDDLLVEVTREISRSREDFIVHHLKRGEKVPIWAAVEALSFGTVSKIYRLILNEDVRYGVAKSFGLDPELTESIMRALVVFRNVCAHHGRIWNRVPRIPLRVPKVLKTDPDTSIYQQTPWGILVTTAWLVDEIRRNDSFSSELWRHIDAYPELRDGLTRAHRR